MQVISKKYEFRRQKRAAVALWDPVLLRVCRRSVLRVVLLTVLLVLSHSVFADKALVVGSFTDPDNAGP
jgi:hypothetical protein